MLVGQLGAPCWPGIADDSGAIVGADGESLLAESAGGLTPTLLAALGALGAVVGICFVIVDMVSGRARIDYRAASSDPEVAGILATGFVTSKPAHWVAASIVHVAIDGVVALIDQRTPQSSAAADETEATVLLEFTSDPEALAGAVAAGHVESMIVRALFDGIPERGDRVPLHRTGATAIRLLDVTNLGLTQLSGVYFSSWSLAHPRRIGAIACLVGALAGLAAVVVALSTDASQAFVGLGTLVLGVVGFSLGMHSPEPGGKLNSAGHALRDRARRGVEAFEAMPIRSLSEGERILPWAVLFGLRSVITRFGKYAEEAGIAPTWYRFDGRFSASRFASCIGLVEVRMMAPQAANVGGGG